MNKDITIVTGLWDLGRGNVDGWSKRDFKEYKNRFFELLETDIQMCIWIPKELEEEVKNVRGNKPTRIFIKSNEDFKTWNPFYNEINKIRTSENWLNNADWLRESPQASLELYNPMMFTKMFMVNDSAIINPFDSEYFFWVDGGLTNTVNKGYFTHDLVLNNLPNYCKSNGNKFVHVSYPYTSNEEIHGFTREGMNKYCNVDFVNLVSRGGFFGGEKSLVHEVNTLYYNIMEDTLRNNLMGADESLFTILAYRFPQIIHRFIIEGDGLVWPFFEELKKYTKTNNDVGLYVIGFNSPKQFETLVTSMLEYDKNFILKPKKFLLDNSTDLSTTEKYKELCEKHGFEHIKKNNLGICGGRQFIAEHAHDNNFDYYFFFEDDMFFYQKKGEVCRNGFNRYVENLYNTILTIMKENEFDFLKMNYSEFYGDNGTQWAWYNVPQEVRNKYFPWKKDLPVMGLDPDAPRTQFNSIKTKNGVSYAEGEIYYSNWPQIVSNNGNILMFLVDKWERPYEQTWMSYIYQETKKGNIKPALLLLTPTEHDRFDFYPPSERKES